MDSPLHDPNRFAAAAAQPPPAHKGLIKQLLFHGKCAFFGRGEYSEIQFGSPGRMSFVLLSCLRNSFDTYPVRDPPSGEGIGPPRSLAPQRAPETCPSALGGLDVCKGTPFGKHRKPQFSGKQWLWKKYIHENEHVCFNVALYGKPYVWKRKQMENRVWEGVVVVFLRVCLCVFSFLFFFGGVPQNDT